MYIDGTSQTHTLSLGLLQVIDTSVSQGVDAEMGKVPFGQSMGNLREDGISTGHRSRAGTTCPRDRLDRLCKFVNILLRRVKVKKQHVCIQSRSSKVCMYLI